MPIEGFRDRIRGVRKAIKFLPPPRFKWFRREFRAKAFRVLDIGCGNHSPSLTKAWFPLCEYHGVDKEEATDEQDRSSMDTFYRIDLASQALTEIPDEHFDVIILNHVVEHLPNGLAVLKEATGKLNQTGRLYIEYPSVRSLSFPRMKGTLNFCDDPTHIRLYDLKEIANVLLDSGMTVVKGGTRREWWRVFAFPLLVVFTCLQGNPASPFWDLLGFAEFVYAVKKHDAPEEAPRI